LIAAAFMTAACSEGSPTNPDPEAPLLEPPPEGQGVQFSMVTEIPAGTEAEHCQFFRAPPEGMNVNRDEVKFTSGSHHVLLYVTPYTDLPTEDEAGNPIDASKPFDCSNGVTFNFRVTNLVAGSQNATGESIVDFPEDVAMKVPGNAVLILNVHYVNTSPEPLKPEVAVNVWTVPDAQVKHEGGLLFWYNPFIRVDPNGEGLSKMSCPLPNDITIRNAQSHMHRRGVDYAAVMIAPDASRETIYESTRWEGVDVKRWEEGLSVSAGSRIEYHCGYKNPESRTVYQGPKSSDEMCMFIASYWPAAPEISNCAVDPDDINNTQNMNADWVGNGAATCGQTLTCVQGIEASPGDFFGFIRGLTDCVLESRAESSEVVSDGIRCLLTREDPLTECQAEIQACLNE
jgi:hypothetical protein